MIIGTMKDGRKLAYDESIYQFTIDDRPVTISEVKMADADSGITWDVPEQHAWFTALSVDDFEKAHESALEARVINVQPAYDAPQPAGPWAQQDVNGKRDRSGVAIIVAVVIVFLLALACALLFAFVFIPKIRTGSSVVINQTDITGHQGHPITETQETDYVVGSDGGASYTLAADRTGNLTCTIYR